jgi:N-acetylated-alpha-linked acidic dipeptidase
MLPETKPEVPYIAFAPLLNAIDALTDAAEAADRAVANAAQHPERLAELNRALYRTERAMTHESGLPRRPWFRHQIYAPGLYTGYGVKTLPGVREAIEERYWEEADREINRLSGTLRALAAELRAVAGR